MRNKWNQFCSRFLDEEKRNYGIIVVLILFWVTYYVVALVAGLTTTVLLDWVLPEFQVRKLVLWCIYCAVICLVYYFMNGTVIGYFYYRYEIKLTRQQLTRSMLNIFRKPVYEINQYNDGYLMNLAFNDVSTVVSVSIQMVVQIAALSISILVTLGVLWYISPKIVILELVLVPLYILSMVGFRKRIKQTQATQRIAKDRLDGSILNILKHKKSITLLQQDDYFQNEIDRSYDPYVKRVLDYWKNYFCAKEIPQVILTLGNTALLVIAVFAYQKNQMTLGTLVYIETVSSILMSHVRNLLECYLRKMANQISFQRLDAFYEPSDAPEIYHQDTIENGIELKNIELSIEEHPLYYIPSFYVPKSGLVVIRGANGSGKSTLMNWLMGIISFENVSKRESGIIRLQKNLFEHTSYLSSPNILLEDSVEENILLGREKTEKFQDIIDMLGIDFLDKAVTNRPVNLSLGEQQKVFLARILCRESEVLILDEPLTNLDQSVRASICEYLKKLKQSKIIIVISHDDSVEENADLIYDIKDGILVEEKNDLI